MASVAVVFFAGALQTQAPQSPEGHDTLCLNPPPDAIDGWTSTGLSVKKESPGSWWCGKDRPSFEVRIENPRGIPGSERTVETRICVQKYNQEKNAYVWYRYPSLVLEPGETWSDWWCEAKDFRYFRRERKKESSPAQKKSTPGDPRAQTTTTTGPAPSNQGDPNWEKNNRDAYEAEEALLAHQFEEDQAQSEAFEAAGGAEGARQRMMETLQTVQQVTAAAANTYNTYNALQAQRRQSNQTSLMKGPVSNVARPSLRATQLGPTTKTGANPACIQECEAVTTKESFHQGVVCVGDAPGDTEAKSMKRYHDCEASLERGRIQYAQLCKQFCNTHPEEKRACYRNMPGKDPHFDPPQFVICRQ